MVDLFELEFRVIGRVGLVVGVAKISLPDRECVMEKQYCCITARKFAIIRCDPFLVFFFSSIICQLDSCVRSRSLLIDFKKNCMSSRLLLVSTGLEVLILLHGCGIQSSNVLR